MRLAEWEIDLSEKSVLGSETSSTEAVEVWKTKVVLRRLPAVLVGIGIGMIAYFTWRPGGGWGQYAAVVLVAFLIGESLVMAYLERNDPALVALSADAFQFRWVSGRSLEVGVDRIGCVRRHESSYFNLRRAYPIWYEIEFKGISSRVIVAGFNLTPEAEKCLLTHVT